jgi:hypothetical protein
MASGVESEQNPQGTTSRYPKLLHVGVTRGLDDSNHGSLQTRTMFGEQHHPSVEGFLLILGEIGPPSFELVCVFDLPHSGIIRCSF